MYTLVHTASVACASFAILAPYHGAYTTQIMSLVLYLIMRYVLDAVATNHDGDPLSRCLFTCICSQGLLILHTGLLKNSITKPGLAITLSYILPVVLDVLALHACLVKESKRGPNVFHSTPS